MESVSGMEWNQCPLSRGIGVRIALEYSCSSARVSVKLVASKYEYN
jgi:hypothetical protein